MSGKLAAIISREPQALQSHSKRTAGIRAVNACNVLNAQCPRVCHHFVTTKKKAREIRGAKTAEVVGKELVAGAGFEPATFRL